MFSRYFTSINFFIKVVPPIQNCCATLKWHCVPPVEEEKPSQLYRRDTRFSYFRCFLFAHKEKRKRRTVKRFACNSIKHWNPTNMFLMFIQGTELQSRKKRGKKQHGTGFLMMQTGGINDASPKNATEISTIKSQSRLPIINTKSRSLQSYHVCHEVLPELNLHFNFIFLRSDVECINNRSVEFSFLMLLPMCCPGRASGSGFVFHQLFASPWQAAQKYHRETSFTAKHDRRLSNPERCHFKTVPETRTNRFFCRLNGQRDEKCWLCCTTILENIPPRRQSKECTTPAKPLRQRVSCGFWRKLSYKTQSVCR